MSKRHEGGERDDRCDGSELVNQSGKTLEDIVASVKRVTDIIAEISAASQEQASGLDQVNKAVMSMDESTQQNAALLEETTSAAQSMKEQANQLMRQVEIFKVTESQGNRGQSMMKPDLDRPATKPVVKAVSSGNWPKSTLKKPMAGKPNEHKATVGVAAGNGDDRHSTGDEFEEF